MSATAPTSSRRASGWITLLVLFGIAATGIGILVPALSLLYVIAMFVVLVVYTVIAILAIVKALQGQRLIVPGVSRYADRRA